MADDDYRPEETGLLNGPEAVRRRPAMYFGELAAGFAMHQMLWQVIEHAIPSCLDGDATQIAVQVAADRITVEDHGPGIPVHIDPVEGRSVLELHMTVMFGGRNWIGSSRLPFGAGLPAVNALARELEVHTYRDGHAHAQRYARGEPLGPIESRGPTTRTGTRIAFAPDFEILPPHPWNIDAISARCRDLASLFPGLATSVNDEPYRYHDGIADRVREQSGWLDPFHVRASHAGVDIDVALAWTPAASTWLRTFVNADPTTDGTHVDGLFDALEAVIARRLRSATRFRTHIARGLVGMLHVMLEEPRYTSPWRRTISNPEVRDAVRTVIERALARHLDETPALLDSILLQLERPARPRSPDAGR